VADDPNFDIPDSAFEVLDRAGDLLLKHYISDLTSAQIENIDLMLVEVLWAIYHKAEQMAECQPIPGKISEALLEAQIPGYREIRTLATYLEGVFDDQPT
jgi:hypothetical protein